MDPLAELMGESPGMVAVQDRLRRLLNRQSDVRRLPPILILGETGTGKGLLAQAIHRAGPRRDSPFVDVNCAAIPETLLEAEMFGFERGAFTDARQAKAGLFQTAHRGTIFLDEVGLIPEALQAKFLKVIEERAVRRLGSTRSEPADVWVLSATSVDLATGARERRFREDLYHRLAVLTVSLPPLHERSGDILLLAEHFLARACADYGLPRRDLTTEARAALLAYRWPGNVRELANVMERVALLSEAASVTADVLGLPEAPPEESHIAAREDRRAPLEDAVAGVERQHLLEALRETNWNITHAAAQLGISRDTLRYRIAKYGLRPGAPGARPRTKRPSSAIPAPVAPVRAEVAEPRGVHWERRRIALLRATLGASPEADSLLASAPEIERLVEKVQGFGGRVEELSPTGLVAAFGLEPVEDAPNRAAYAAVAIRKAVERSYREGAEQGAIRIAIHAGQFLVGHGTGTLQMELDAKHEASRVLEGMLSGAGPNAILVSEAAAPFLERRFELAPLAVEEAPGRTHLLVGHERSGFEVGRRMAPFVGRRHELELLQSRLGSALRGRGQVVGIVGEAGIGKSRLLFEFRQSLAGQPVTYLEGHCLSYAIPTPYLQLVDILRQTFEITETDPPEAIAEKVRVGLRELGLDSVEAAPYLLQLQGMEGETGELAALSPEAARERTFEVLRARIDGLADEPRRLLQTASVLGATASSGLLRALWEGSGVLDPHLRELTRLEFLYPEAGGEEPVYVFTHAITQDIAYECLPIARRRTIHGAAGRALEALYADRLEEVSDRLAYHYSRAEQAEKAVKYLTLFAEKAARGYAHVEALAAVQEAIAHVERLPAGERDRRRLDLVLRYVNSLNFLGRFQEIVAVLLEHREHLEQLQEPSLTGPYYFWLAHTFSLLGDPERAVECALRALEEAKRCGDEMTMGKAYFALAYECF